MTDIIREYDNNGNIIYAKHSYGFENNTHYKNSTGFEEH